MYYTTSTLPRVSSPLLPGVAGRAIGLTYAEFAPPGTTQPQTASDCGSEGRGFALPRLQIRYAPVVATLILGLGWALWHLPLAFVDPR